VIHSTAIIHKRAKLDPSVRIGPYVVIDENVELGPGCVLGPFAHLTGTTVVGANNRFFAGCVIGEAPQDLKYDGSPTRLRVGDNNVFREHVTIHRSARLEDETRIGSNNFLMAHCHVAHNCYLGDHIVVANGALVAGHVSIGDRAFISGNCLLHQFVRVGKLALMQGGSAISKDLPPFTVARGGNNICGLNTVGLRRAGFTAAERLEIKQLYHSLFRQGENLQTAIAQAESKFTSAPCRVLLDFLKSSKRGVCTDAGIAYGEEADEA
jgi:UDP-N-acetylglucosamine acyltransferase